MTEEEAIEKLCRAYCKAKGYDPDVTVMIDRKQILGPKGMIALPDPDRTIPAWEAFRTEAKIAYKVLIQNQNEE